MVNPNCFICNTKKTQKVIVKNNCVIWKCPTCKLFFVNPQPDIKTLKKIYSKEGKYARTKTKLNKENFSKEFLKRIDFLISNNKKRVLDVGCGAGDFIYIAKKRGLQAQGVELNKDLAKFGLEAGLNIFVGELSSAKYKNNSFDAIHLGEIIEHFKNPRELLKECYGLLKKKGILIVSTPNSNSFFPKMTFIMYIVLKIPWSHVTPPHHLFDFSDKNLSILLKEEDFEIEKVTYSRISLAYSIYKTGCINEIRNKMDKISNKELLKALKKSSLKSVLLFLGISSISSLIYILDRIISLFNKKGTCMTIYTRKNEKRH